jgi:formylglycine-generating enzyme required for sulfatase activity
MTIVRALLTEFRRLAAAGVKERRHAASLLARSLGAEWDAATPVANEINLPLLHRPTGFAFVAIPGGRFDMGLSDQDLEEASEYIDWSAAIAQWTQAMARRARPVHRVRVRPFVCARRPLFTLKEAKKVHAPHTLLSREAALDVARSAGFRLLTEAEFEWVARDGRRQAMTANAGRRYRADEDDGGDGPGPESRLGLELLDVSNWVADDWHETYKGAPADSAPWMGDDPAGVRRSGFFYPEMQSADELLSALAAARFRGGEPCMVRLARNLP